MNLALAAILWMAASMLGEVGAAPGKTPIAFLGKIDPGVRLLHDKAARTLDPKRDVGKVLYAGDTLECAAGAKAMGFLARSDGTRSSLPQDLCQPKLLTDVLTHLLQGEVIGKRDFTQHATVLETYAKLGGRSKGDDVAVFAPPDHGAALADKFVVRWRTRPPLDTLAIILEDEQGIELARVADVNGAEGVLESEVLRKALGRYQSSTGEHKVKLILRDKGSPEQSVVFTILTKQQESDLNRELHDPAIASDLFGYVQRASIYDSFGLYDEVATEYDAALKVAPESHDLLLAAFNAHTRIGDFRAARDLRDRLAQSEDEK
jgi:hypothetical protein